MNKILKIGRLVIITTFIFACSSVSIPQETNKNLNTTLNDVIDLNAMAVKYEEINLNDLYSVKDVYNGDLTGYAANCPLCSGNLGCNGQNVLDGTLEYLDEDYGNVRIVASSNNLKCGSIVQFDLPNISDKPIIAIVLDRGVRGTNLDLLVESEEYARQNIGRHKISYNVLRSGYEKAN